MKILAVYSSKGGVGKTAAAVNLAYAAAVVRGLKVLLCDMDSQGAASYYFRIQPKKKFNSQKLLEGDVGAYVRETDFANLELLPSHFSFRNLDIHLHSLPKERRRLTLNKLFSPLAKHYDVLLLDCPPNLTLLSENIIVAADRILTPVVPTTLSLIAFDQLLRLFNKIDVDQSKIMAFFSMIESRKAMHKAVIEKYQKFPIFLKAGIPYLAEIEKMGLSRRPVAAMDTGTVAARSYLTLWDEIWEAERA